MDFHVMLLAASRDDSPSRIFSCMSSSSPPSSTSKTPNLRMFVWNDVGCEQERGHDDMRHCSTMCPAPPDTDCHRT